MARLVLCVPIDISLSNGRSQRIMSEIDLTPSRTLREYFAKPENSKTVDALDQILKLKQKAPPDFFEWALHFSLENIRPSADLKMKGVRLAWLGWITFTFYYLAPLMQQAKQADESQSFPPNPKPPFPYKIILDFLDKQRSDLLVPTMYGDFDAICSMLESVIRDDAILLTSQGTEVQCNNALWLCRKAGDYEVNDYTIDAVGKWSRVAKLNFVKLASAQLAPPQRPIEDILKQIFSRNEKPTEGYLRELKALAARSSNLPDLNPFKGRAVEFQVELRRRLDLSVRFFQAGNIIIGVSMVLLFLSQVIFRYSFGLTAITSIIAGILSVVGISVYVYAVLDTLNYLSWARYMTRWLSIEIGPSDIEKDISGS